MFEDTGSGFDLLDLGSASVDVDLLDVDQLSDGATLRISGQYGAMLFRDSSTWSRVRSRTTEDLGGISFLGADEGFGFGTRSLIIKYDDT